MTCILPQSCFAAWTSDVSLRKKSTSGGIFTELSRSILSSGGIVVGAGWQKNPLRVVHKCVEKEEELDELRGSKYVMSDITSVLPLVRKHLEEGKNVLFTGTPCQTAVFRKMFGNDEHLTLCALFCYGNVDAKLWLKFLNEQEKKIGSNIISAKFRDKRMGWHNPALVLECTARTKSKILPFYDTVYGRAFDAALSLRDGCLRCPFRCGQSGADLMIGDFWGIEKELPDRDWSLGVNAVLVYTQKGTNVLNKAHIELLTVSYKQILEGNYCLEYSPTPNLLVRSRFKKAIHLFSFERAIRIAELGYWSELKCFLCSCRSKIVNGWLGQSIRKMFFFH